jgi:demethylmenaquinone methyltransferase/2-methoxy-6-polyprenyl-1,4-benzoquinol methylase
LSHFFSLWFDRAVPALGRLAGDADAYSYLPNSVRRFPGPEGLAEAMWGCGLREIRYLVTAGGIIAIHVGVVSER